MTWNRFALVAVGCLLFVSPAIAAPTIGFVDNLDGTVTLQVTPSGTGPIATELAAAVSGLGGLDITAVALVDAATFDIALPGNNPFTGGVTNGLQVDLVNDTIFASFGSIVLSSASPLDFLLISYTGVGTIDAFGLVAEGGQNFTGLAASIAVGIPEPGTLLLAGLALLSGIGRRRF